MQLIYISHFGRILLGIDWKDFGFNIAKQISVQKTKRDASEGQQSMSAGLENDLKTSVRELTINLNLKTTFISNYLRAYQQEEKAT